MHTARSTARRADKFAERRRHHRGVERANDVKLSRGGIREIEFIVQLLQVVRGGQFPELRTRPTLDALTRVAAAGLMPVETAEALSQAYIFLRRVEHRIQYLDDQQTHVLPMDCSDNACARGADIANTAGEAAGASAGVAAGCDLAWIARTMGYAHCPDFLAALDAHRRPHRTAPLAALHSSPDRTALKERERERKRERGKTGRNKEGEGWGRRKERR